MATILVCDDDALIRRTLGGLVEAAGHTPLVAAGPDDARRLARESAPRAVILDLSLDGASGWDLAAEFKKADDAPHVLLVTGWRLDDTPEELAARGVDEVIYKPFDGGAVIERLRELLP